MALTNEQQQALDELFNAGRLDKTPLPNTSTLADTPKPATPATLRDALAPYLAKLQPLLQTKDDLTRQALDIAERYPLDSAVGFLAAASVVFYAAERGHNPKITSYIDAFYYISTCASVGYADIFAFTQTGRAIASLVMIVGPALTSHTLDRPTESPAQNNS